VPVQPLPGTRKPGPRRMHGDVSGPGRAAAGAVGGGSKGSGPPAADGDPRARVPLIIGEGNLATEGDDLPGAECHSFAPNAESARKKVGQSPPGLG
jgi:hypothetical protein